MVRDLKIPFKLEGITRVDDTPVHKAVREALANCIVNTDFYISRGVVIKKDIDKIVMESPGYIRTGAKTRDIAHYIGLSDTRTRALLAELVQEGLIDTKGNGRNRVYVTCPIK